MGLLKWLCKRFKCNSSCAYDGNEAFLDNEILNQRLSNYQLKLKDVKKIYRILGKRETICVDKKDIMNSLV
jgi:hypothetical protein